MALSNISFRPFIAGMRPEPTINPSGAILMGLGTSTLQPADSQADKNWLSFYLKSSATSGTSRGMYLRLYLSGGAGGEALRAFTTVSNAAPADTVNGAHISLNFGTSAGNVTGEAQAVRATFHLGNRTMTGTNAAIKAEIYSDGSSSDPGGNMAFLRMVNAGDSTGMAAVDTSGFFFCVDGLTANTGKMLRAAAPTTLAASLRVKVGATTYYLPLYSAAS
jgi:hypothetical protein